MTVINLTDIQQDADATPDLFNSRFDAIINVINGHIDATNIADGAVTTPKIADGAVTLAKLDTVTAGNATGGWLPISATPSAVVANGNRSYSLTFTGTNLTTTLSPGMRLRTTRNTLAPTQCTSLNGTNQFWNKTSPAGMTFTDDFTVSAWVKMTKYGAVSTIESRYNGTSGWYFLLTSAGQLQLTGANGGAANFSLVQSVQSIPINKWVHVVAQLDMSSFTATPTTSYMMIDGMDVPVTLSRGGTNPTALIQAGNFEIGSNNAGANPFPGGLSQVAVFNSKVTQATMKTYFSQGLLGTETSLISAYSFNNSITDLNTTNANNLTANNAATATTADSPFGGQSGGTISSTLDYGIVSSVSFSTNTTVVVQVPEGCTIPTIGTISAVAYSSNKSPYGFPTNEDKWYIKALWLLNDQLTTASVTYVQINSRQINVPAGQWIVGFMADLTVNSGGASGDHMNQYIAMSTSSTSADDPELVARMQWYTTGISGGTVGKFNGKNLSVATTFYVVYKSVDGLQIIAGRGGNDVFYARYALL